VNVPVPCGGVVVNPGDLIVADDDGVLVIPIGEAERVLVAALERDARERETIERIRRGERLFDIMGFSDADDRH
jgi:4-hydroxy-4-methyl-2-oxoglutarate aldolase